MVLRTDAAGIAHETDGRSRIPYARYRHRKLSTADSRGVDRLNGEAETVPAGELCEFLAPRGS